MPRSQFTAPVEGRAPAPFGCTPSPHTSPASHPRQRRHMLKATAAKLPILPGGIQALLRHQAAARCRCPAQTASPARTRGIRPGPTPAAGGPGPALPQGLPFGRGTRRVASRESRPAFIDPLFHDSAGSLHLAPIWAAPTLRQQVRQGPRPACRGQGRSPLLPRGGRSRSPGAQPHGPASASGRFPLSQERLGKPKLQAKAQGKPHFWGEPRLRSGPGAEIGGKVENGADVHPVGSCGKGGSPVRKAGASPGSPGGLVEPRAPTGTARPRRAGAGAAPQGSQGPSWPPRP